MQCRGRLIGIAASALAACALSCPALAQVVTAPYLPLTLGNSCNDAVDNPEVNARLAQTFELPQDPNPGGEGDFHNLELLTDFSGHIIASACSPGQHSYTTDEEGSFFINDLFAELDNALDSEQSISWKTILEKTKTRVKKEGNGQTPQYWISHN